MLTIEVSDMPLYISKLFQLYERTYEQRECTLYLRFLLAVVAFLRLLHSSQYHSPFGGSVRPTQLRWNHSLAHSLSSHPIMLPNETRLQ